MPLNLKVPYCCCKVTSLNLFCIKKKWNILLLQKFLPSIKKKKKIKRKQTYKKKCPPHQSAQSTVSFSEAKYWSNFRKSNLPGTGYNSSHEFGGNRDWTFSKGCAVAFRSKISRKALLQVNRRKQLFENSKWY